MVGVVVVVEALGSAIGHVEGSMPALVAWFPGGEALDGFGLIGVLPPAGVGGRRFGGGEFERRGLTGHASTVWSSTVSVFITAS